MTQGLQPEYNPPPPPAASLPPAGVPHRIASDAQALRVARELAAIFAADAVRRDRRRVLEAEAIDAFSASGIWGITVPAEYGGAGVSSVTLAEVIAILAAADGSLGQLPQNHFYALEVLRVGGTEAQRRAFYSRVLAGERFGNALAEVGHKDFKRRTTMTADGGGWRIDGRKFYCTGAPYAHWIPTLAVAEEGGKAGGHLVFVPRDAAGVKVIDDWDGFGQRLTGSGTVVFDGVHVERDWVLPYQASFEVPTPLGPFAQLMHAAIDLGIGRGAFQAMLEFVREKARPWVGAGVETASADPLTIHQVGEVDVRLNAAHALLRRAARAVDAAQRDATERSVAEASIAVAQARVLTTTASLLASNKLLELGGSSATLDQQGLDRFWRNARTHTLHDPVRWKYQAIGNFALNGTLPARHGAL